MKRPNFYICGTLALALTLGACAKDDKKEHLSRVKPGSENARKPRTDGAATAEDDAAKKAEAAAKADEEKNKQAAGKPTDPKAADAAKAAETAKAEAAKAEAAKAAAAKKEVKRLRTETCRLTDNDALSDEQKEQSYCEGVYVALVDGKIKFDGLQMQKNYKAYDKFTIDKSNTSKDVRLSHKFTAVELKDGDKTFIFTAFKLPHKKSEISETLDPELYVNGGKLKDELYEIVTPDDEKGNPIDELYVVIIEAEEVLGGKDIDYSISIDYNLK